MIDIPDLEAAQITRLFQRRELSSVEVTQAVLHRIDQLDPLLNTYAARDDAASLEMAKAADARWAKGEPASAIDGVPISIKDLVLTRGLPTGRGTMALPADPGNHDAPIAARLREAGAVILGKTTVSELAWKGVGDCPATGVTRNPWNPAYTPGASSAGAAAGLAAGLAFLATGSDGGGSIRIPASFTGVFGIKPTFGLVPSYPPSPVGTLSHLGPLARSVTDAALMLNIISARDAKDWYTVPSARQDFTVGLNTSLQGLKVAYSPDLGYAEVDPNVADVVASAVKVFEELGAIVEIVDSPLPASIEIYRPLFLAAYAHMSRDWTPKQLDMLDPGLYDVIIAGRRVTLEQYLTAAAARERFAIAAQLFFEDYDLLLTPTMPIVALPVGQDTLLPTESVPNWLDWNPFTYPLNLTQQPAASVPCGFIAEDLPVGLQIIGPKFADALVLNASHQFELARPFVMPDAATILAKAATFQPH